MGIIYMSVMFVIMIALTIVIFVIKHKIHVIQRNIEEKFAAVTNAVHMGEAIVEKAKDVFKHKK
jgi:predicted Holliday junction resolvase-like endonuclease